MTDHTCAEPGCAKPPRARGYCSGHYQAHTRAGDFPERAKPGRKPRQGPPPECSEDGCSHSVRARSLCGTHYDREYRAGRWKADPLRTPRVGAICTAEDCDQPVKGHGLCKRHYEQATRLGTLPGRSACAFDGCDRATLASSDLCRSHHHQRAHGKPLRAIQIKMVRGAECAFRECGRAVLAKGLCSAHYWQQSQGKDLAPITEWDPRGEPCKADGCDRLSERRGLCQTHARRSSRGDEDWDRQIDPKAPNGTGYVGPDGYRHLTINGRRVSEHRHIMEQLLGRPLPEGSSVHHLNGDRLDNTTDGPLRVDADGRLRSGNLVLWSSAQPAGQEVTDKVAYARQILADYGGLVLEGGTLNG